jgi:predicted regulator of Ras-like GTPase activity (Roadblock/LC7/MglB family)
VDSELERLRKKVENFPSASAYNRLAELVRQGGDVPGAEQVCRRCIKEFPRNGQAYVILAEIEMLNGRKHEAVQNLLTAVERDSRSYTAHRMLADYYADNGKAAQAVQHLRHILTFKANDAAVIQRIEQLSPRAGQPAAAAPAPGTGRHSLSGARPAVAPAPDTARILPMPSAQPDGLAALGAEPGVRGALLADAKGRVVTSVNLARAQEDVLAALACDLATAAQSALIIVGQERLTMWTLMAQQGQVLMFRRDPAFSVVVLADPGVRPAMLEIRARQALIDLGGA